MVSQTIFASYIVLTLLKEKMGRGWLRLGDCTKDKKGEAHIVTWTDTLKCTELINIRILGPTAETDTTAHS